MIHFSFVPKSVKHPRAYFQWIMRDIRLGKERRRLLNRNFSIVSNNCLGAMITHDYFQPFLSPTVNLYIKPRDFVRLLHDFPNNLNKKLEEVEDESPFPVASLNESLIYFQHYRSFNEAVCKWESRKKRINWDNLLFILTERDDCTYDVLKEFDELPYKNKIALVHKSYPDIKSAIVFPGYDDQNEVGVLTDWANLFGKRVYDGIDWIGIINGMKK